MRTAFGRDNQASTADTGPDRLCRHEHDDGTICAFTAQPGTARCPGHQDDGQPDP